MTTRTFNGLNFKPYQTAYAFDISVIAYQNIEFRDSEEANWSDTLAGLLDDMVGVHGVDYNGHFGSKIFLTIERDYDTIPYRNYLAAVIYAYATGKDVQDISNPLDDPNDD